MTSPSPVLGIKRVFDPAQLIHAALSYEKHFRLMLVLFLFGLLAGVVYFVFSRATFTSTSLIKVYQYTDPARAASNGVEGRDPYRLMTVVDQLNSPPQVLATALGLGACAPSMGYLELVEMILPGASVGIADSTHLQVSVTSYEAPLVRSYPQAIIDQFYKQRNQIEAEYRKKAIDRYLADLTDVRQKVREQMISRLDFEEKSSIAQTQIELEQLSDVPVALVRTRYRLAEFDRIQKVLDERGEALGTIGQLSLISAAQSDKNDPLKTGKIVRSSSKSLAQTPVNFVNPPTPIVTEVVVQPDMVQGLNPWERLERDRRSAEEELQTARVRYGEQNDVVTKIKDRIARINRELESELEVARKAFDLESQRLRQQLGDLQVKIKDYHEASRNYDEKKMDFDLLEKSQLAWDKAFQDLSRNLNALQDSGGVSADVEMTFDGFTNVRDVDPVSPSKFKLAMLGTLLGLGLAIGVPFALQKLDLSVASLTQCENSAGAYAIGVIPETDQASLECINRSPLLDSSIPHPLLEGFRLVRSGVLVYGSPKGNKVILVTSARPSEGKTTICANLAWAFYSAGERTVVVDCDLRRGRLHKVMSQASTPGLVDYLMGHIEMKDIIRPTVLENLYCVTRGSVVASASELLNSHRFASLIDYLRSNFDRVLLDTPPVLGLSETPHIQKFADGAVVVTMADKTPRKHLATACDTLRRLGVHIYGCVLNRVDFNQRKNIYGYYYYSTYYYTEMIPDDQHTT